MTSTCWTPRGWTGSGFTGAAASCAALSISVAACCIFSRASPGARRNTRRRSRIFSVASGMLPTIAIASSVREYTPSPSVPTKTATATAAPTARGIWSALERGDQRREAVADQHAQDDRNEDGLGVLQHQDDREHRDDGQRGAPDVYGRPDDDRRGCFACLWGGRRLGSVRRQDVSGFLFAHQVSTIAIVD